MYLQPGHNGNDHGAALGVLEQIAADGGAHGFADLALILPPPGGHTVHGVLGNVPQLLQQLLKQLQQQLLKQLLHQHQLQLQQQLQFQQVLKL